DADRGARALRYLHRNRSEPGRPRAPRCRAHRHTARQNGVAGGQQRAPDLRSHCTARSTPRRREVTLGTHSLRANAGRDPRDDLSSGRTARVPRALRTTARRGAMSSSQTVTGGVSVIAHHSAAAFLERAGAWLLEREAEHNLLLGIAQDFAAAG